MKGTSRRNFLKLLGAGGAVAGSGVVFPRLFVDNAHADGLSKRRVVHIFQNGGCDWFTMHRPDGNGAIRDVLATIRPTLSMDLKDNNGVVMPRLPLGNTEYTLHNRLPYLKALYDQGKLALCQSFGVPQKSNGSHEQQQFFIKAGLPVGNVLTGPGWMQKIAAANFGDDEFMVVDLAGGGLATTGGTYKPLALSNLSTYGFSTTATGEGGFKLSTAFSMLNRMEGNSKEEEYARAWSQIEGSVQKVQAAVSSTTLNPAFPATGLGNQLRDVFRAFVNFPTCCMGYAEFGGFDLHEKTDPQGQTAAAPQGQSARLNEMNNALEAFFKNMERAGMASNLIVIVNSEFGRTNRENGSLGLDHGNASCALAMGAVNGGHYGDAPTVTNLNRGANSMPPTFASTDLYAEIATAMGYNKDVLIPAGFTPTDRNIIKKTV